MFTDDVFKPRNMTTRTSLLFALLLSVSDVLSIEKRGDDVEIQSLMTLVQQQAATIQQQAATMEVMKTQLTGLQTSVQQQSGAISELNTRLHTQGLSVCMTGEQCSVCV